MCAQYASIGWINLIDVEDNNGCTVNVDILEACI